MNENPPSKFWVILVMKVAVALIVHLIENISDQQFLSKMQAEMSSVNGRIKKKREESGLGLNRETVTLKS